MHDADADGFEFQGIEDVRSVEIVELAVDDEVEIFVSQRAGGGKHGKGGAIFEDGCFGYVQAVAAESELGDTRGADAVLNGDERVFVPIETVGARERVVRAGIDFGRGMSAQVHAEDAELI